MKINRYVIDTSFLISLFAVDDSNHEAALRWMEDVAEHPPHLVIPGDVLTELLNIVGRRKGHQEASKLAEGILESGDYDIAETTSDIRTAALAFFKESANSVSFTDCVVMAIANAQDTRNILGFDKIFKQAGYNAYEKAA